jgi:hypothetical protein
MLLFSLTLPAKSMARMAYCCQKQPHLSKETQLQKALLGMPNQKGSAKTPRTNSLE